MTERKTLFLLFLAGLIFRILHCFFFAYEIIPGSDQMQEILLGRKFASGDFYGVLDTYWAPVYPTLIGIVSLFIESLVIPAAFISILAGSLIVPLTYILVHQSYGRREALIAGAIAVFFPHLINSVFTLGSENVYICLLLITLIVAWKALQGNSTILYLTTGVILGFAYLTRPEAIGYTVYFVPFVFIYNLVQKRSFLRDSLPQAAGLILCFFLVAAPYIFYLHQETGTWTVSGKAQVNMIASEISEDADANNLNQTLSGGRIGKFGKLFLVNMVEVHKSFPVLFPLPLFLLIGLGLFRDSWGKVRIEREIYLILFCFVTVLGYAAAVVQLRYLFVLLPILFGWTAHGIVYFSDWFHDSLQKATYKSTMPMGRKALTGLVVAAIYLIALPLNFYMVSAERSWETRAYEEREAGLWLRKNGKSAPTVFSGSLRPVFYGEGKLEAPATENVSEILRQIGQCHVDYMMFSERFFKRKPYLKEVVDIVQYSPEFELIYETNDQPGYRMSIFRLKTCSSTST